MTRQLTFRGSIDVADNARSTNNKIFAYESSDLTRAWKVKEYYIWPESIRAISGGDGQFMVCSSVATDTIDPDGFDDVVTVNDNRQIGWMMKGLQDNRAIIDPDHIINRHLYINLYSTSDNSASPIRRYNYIIILEPMKISENEAILQLVKGVAQNITS